MNIRVMYDGAVSYYVSDHADAAGHAVPHYFPSTVGPTPVAVPVATRVLVAPAAWDVPEWMALNFAPHDAIRYSYSFVNNGQSGANAVGQMIAQGDLNGNGVPSLFSRACIGTGDGVQGGSALVVINEIE